MSGEGIDVVLTSVGADLGDLIASARSALGEARAVSAGLDDVERQLGGAPGGGSSVPALRREPVVGDRGPSGWEQIRAEASANLAARGVDPGEVDLDSLLSAEEVARIERRFAHGYSLQVRLDRYDLMFAAAIGLAATLVDWLVVKVPRDVRWEGEWQQGSGLTSLLRELAVPSDNWLARRTEVSFDVSHTAGGARIGGMAGRTHRVQTFGHDPLLGLALGTVDIIRGTVTGVTPGRGMFVHDTTHGPVPNPLRALALEVGHLMSDLPTRAGLPLPGWSVLTTIDAGNLGGRGIDEWARLMYVRGYDTWHFLTMATVPATVQLLVRAYWGLRQEIDASYAELVEAERGPTGERVGGHPRFDSLLLAAHTVAAAGNAAKLVAYGGNPLAVNYDEWLAFFRAAFARMNSVGATVGERLATAGFRNAAALGEGWVRLAAVELPDWPGS